MITFLYAGVMGLFFLFLTFHVIRYRIKHRISLLDGGDGRMLRLMRTHGNFAEYVPFAILLMFLCETGHAPALLLHFMGIALFAGRVLHGLGMTQRIEMIPGRTYGSVLTHLSILTGALYCLWNFAVSHAISG